MLQQLLMWWFRTSFKLWFSFVKEFGPALVLGLVPCFVISIPVIALFGGPNTSALLFPAHDISQYTVIGSWLGGVAVIYVAGWQVLVQVPIQLARSVNGYFAKR